MSRARKHVLQEALAGEIEPPGPDQCIVRALGARGGNLVEVRNCWGLSNGRRRRRRRLPLSRPSSFLLPSHVSFAPPAHSLPHT